MRFELLQPRSLPEALEMKGKYGDKAKLLAGGTDLMVLMKERGLRTEVVLSLRGIRSKCTS